MLQDRALWGLRGPRTRRASTAELRRRSSVDSTSVPHSARAASSHRPAGKLVESTSDFSLLVAYVEAHGLADADPEESRNAQTNAGTQTKRATASKSQPLPEDEEVEAEEEDVQTVLSLEEELLACHGEEHETLAVDRWQLSKEVMFLVSAFLVLFASGGLILG
ncbi:unnamed protein product [Phytophthora lilii]|uniref:Unnamed protein product n=1 Tax=Phytophthora lilii TaxID=2077276 RepID=A0A9W6X633_9STRA|nr:unnamed protein product [Phytophthora lilii]